MAYTLGAVRSCGQSKETATRKSLPTFRTLRKPARSTPAKTASHKARKLAETRDAVLGKDALEEMFIASHKRFLAIAHSILRNREDAEDAVQEAFLSAHRHLRSFEGRSALRTWFTRIVLNAAFMIQRKRKPSTIQPLFESGFSQYDGVAESIPDSQPDPEMIHAERETLQFIDQKLEKLKPVLRQAFTMAFYGDLSGTEASTILGVSTGTFKARLFHARRKLLDRTERALLTPIRRTPAFTKASRFHAEL